MSPIIHNPSVTRHRTGAEGQSTIRHNSKIVWIFGNSPIWNAYSHPMRVVSAIIIIHDPMHIDEEDKFSRKSDHIVHHSNKMSVSK